MDGDGTAHLLAILPVELAEAGEDFYAVLNSGEGSATSLRLQGLPYAPLETQTNSVT